MKSEWIEIKTGGLPDFRVYGFQTGKNIEVMYSDESVEVTNYQGWGIFGNGLRQFNGITHWRPRDED